MKVEPRDLPITRMTADGIWIRIMRSARPGHFEFSSTIRGSGQRLASLGLTLEAANRFAEKHGGWLDERKELEEKPVKPTMAGWKPVEWRKETRTGVTIRLRKRYGEWHVKWKDGPGFQAKKRDEALAKAEELAEKHGGWKYG